MTTPIDPHGLPGRPCSAAAALELVGDRWSLLVVREVLFGRHRFSDLLHNTGAPRDRLSARLKTLQLAGILEARPYCDRPLRFEYHLTEAGHALAPVLEALREWGDRWAVTEPPAVVRHHEHEYRRLTTCQTCGEPVRRRDLHLVPRPGSGSGETSGPNEWDAGRTE